MRKVIKIEMGEPTQCNNCEFLMISEFLDCYCILSRKYLDEVCGVVDSECPFLKEDDTIVRLP